MPPKIVQALQAKLAAAQAAVRAAKAAALKAAAAKPAKAAAAKPKIAKAKRPRRRAGAAAAGGAKLGAVAPPAWQGVLGGGLGGIGGGAGGLLAAAVGWPPPAGVPPLGPPGAVALPDLPSLGAAKPAAVGAAPKARRRRKAPPVGAPPPGAIAPMPVVSGGVGALPAGSPGIGFAGIGYGGGAPLPGLPPVPALPGGLGAAAAPPMAVASLGPFWATATGPGHWLTGAVHGLHCLALGDTGRFIQVALVDPNTGISLALLSCVSTMATPVTVTDVSSRPRGWEPISLLWMPRGHL